MSVKQKKRHTKLLNKYSHQQYFHVTSMKMSYNDYKTRDSMYTHITSIGHA